MLKISSNFIGNFKIGDNINYNLRVVALLYKYFNQASEHEKHLLCKPIILILISIIEAVLHDFHTRIRTFTLEGVTSLARDVISYVRGKSIDELGKYIASAKKHDFFDTHDTEFYDLLDQLRRLRNRIHIQNTENNFEPNEHDAFTEKRKILAERVLEKILRTMSEKHSRNIDVSIYVDNFELPWVGYFPASNPATETIICCPYCAFPANDYDPDVIYQCLNCGDPF